ncbi:MAG: hypothetical protein E7241_01300 [Lachnospiraceae bacterium]|nr:hypothetical protein [Lachnospiraceae bacterium]
MELDKRFSPKRLMYLIAMFVVAIGCDFVLAFLMKADPYDLINLISGSIILMILGIIWIEYDRATHKYSEERYGNFARIFIAFITSCVIVVGCYMLNLRIVPFSIIALGFSLITGPTTGIIFGSYFSVLYFSVYTIDYRYFILYIVLTIMGAVIARLFTDKDTLLGGSVIMVCTYLLSCCVVVFATEQTLGVDSIIYSMAYGLVSVIVSLYIGWYVARHVDNKQQKALVKLLAEDCKPRKAIESFSKEQYKECLYISEMTYEAAEYIGADSTLAKAGGLYSRIGLIGGEALERTNVELAEHYNFPTNLTQLLYEVGDKKTRPTSKEAAIVVMAVKCMRAFKQLEADSSRTGWNKEIVLQQIFNKASDGYLFDECGMTMREYLCVKDCFSRKVSGK